MKHVGRGTMRSVAELRDGLLVHIKELGKSTAKRQQQNREVLASVLADLMSSCVSADVVWTHFGDVLLSFVGDGDELSDEAIRIITALLEIEGSCREVVWLHCDTIYERLLAGIARLTTAGSTANSQYERLQLSVRVVLKLEQHLFDRWKKRRSNDCDSSFCQRISDTLIQVMNNSDCPLESVFLAGTALAFHLNSLDVLRSHLQLSSLLESVQPIEASFSKISLEEKKIDAKRFITGRSLQLPIIHGLLVCGKPDILLSRSYALGIMQGTGLLILDVLPLVAGFCDGGDHRVYQSFQTLLAWLGWLRDNRDQMMAKTQSQILFAIDDPVLATVLRILDLGFSSPVTGVPDLSWDAYDILLEIQKWNAGNGFLDLLNTAMNLPWTVKGKYPQLAMLVPHVGMATLLLHFPRFLEELCQSLASNPLASAGSVVYRNLLTLFRSECANLSEEEMTLRWKTTFLPSLLTALGTSNSICLENVIRHWLPPVIKMFPSAYIQLFSSLTCLRSSPKTFFALTSVLRLARSFGVATFEDVDSSVLTEALVHSDESVRAEAFAIICLSHKKSELVSVAEIEALRSFLPVNLNIVNPAFRGKIFCHSKVLLVRLRDSCINLLTKAKRTKSTHSDNVEEQQLLLRSMNFLDWFLCLLLDNLRLGGCYQRRHTCLNLYRITMEVFVNAPNSNCRKGIVPVKCSDLLRFFTDRGKFELCSDRASRLLLFCILDYMEQIQNLAVCILRSYFPCRLNHKEFTAWALRLCSSPKSMHGESGSRLLTLVFHGLEYAQQLEMIELLLRELTEQLSIAEVDMLAASNDAPMHGLVLALRHIVCFDPDFWSKNGDRSRLLLEKCLCIAERIVRHVLALLASKSDKEEVAPSFEEMGLAIEDIVGSSDKDDPSISTEHQLVSSCCWMSLKECSLLLGSIVDGLPLEGSADNYCLSLCQVDRICRVMFLILTKCRHRGAIEACNLGLEVFCRRLLGGGQSLLMSIVVTMLDSALSELLNTASQTSVTRRSAGLPLLIVTVVKNDQRPCRPLLSVAVTRLLDVAETSFLEDSVDGMVDVPRAHSFHVLRALVHESALSQDILFHMNAIVPACLEGFFSASWAVRNASLQLFGAVVPRLIGQKKVADDDSDHNGMTFSDFCARWPALFILLKSHMRNINVSKGRTYLPETVVPILSLFCRLSSDLSSDDGTEVVELVSPLLSCSMWHVRRMTALFVSKMCPKRRLGRLFLELSHTLCEGCECFNHAHGILLTMLNVVRNLGPSSPSPDLVGKLRQSFSKVSYFVMVTFGCPVLSSALLDVSLASPRWLVSQLDWNQLSKLTTRYSDWEPGFSSWMKSITVVHWRELPMSDLMLNFSGETYLSTEAVEAFLSVLRQRMMNSNIGDSSENYASIQLLLLRFCETCESSAVLRSSLELLLDIFVHSGFGFDLVDAGRVLRVAHSLLSETNGSFLSATAINLWALVIVKDNGLKVTNPENWVERVNHFCQPRLSEEFRLWAAKGLVIGGAFVLREILTLRHSDSFGNPGLNDCVVGIFDSSLTLLQDEEPDVRNQATKFVSSLQTVQDCNTKEIHPNVAIDILGDYFLCHFGWNDKFWTHLWTKIAGDLSNVAFVPFRISHCNNLFEQDDINVYAEKCFMSSFYGRILQILLLNHDVRRWFAETTLVFGTVTCDAVRRLFDLKDSGADNMSVYCEPSVALHVSNLQSCLEVQLAYSSSSNDSREALDNLRLLMGLK